ncbi:MAG: hypothetical protein ACRDLL_09520, partial [Solirubrobacterales bacterium]
AQFQHALAAAATGQAEEAAQAIERCRRLLPAGELEHYLDRIDALLAWEDAPLEALDPLRAALLGQSDEDAAG